MTSETPGPESSSGTVKRAGCLVTLFAGLLCGAIAGILTIVVADAATRAHRVSNMEGGRAYLVMFAFGPLGFMVGFLAGALTMRSGGAPDFRGFMKRFGLALLISAGLIGLVGGISLLTADHAPKIDGHTLVLEFEVRMAGVHGPEFMTTDSLQASLYATRSDNQFTELLFERAEQRDGNLIVPGRAPLRSQSTQRSLLVGPAMQPLEAFHLRLRARPRREDEAWSEWQPPTQMFDGSAPPAQPMYRIRYRVLQDTTGI